MASLWRSKVVGFFFFFGTKIDTTEQLPEPFCWILGCLPFSRVPFPSSVTRHSCAPLSIWLKHWLWQLQLCSGCSRWVDELILAAWPTLFHCLAIQIQCEEESDHMELDVSDLIQSGGKKRVTTLVTMWNFTSAYAQSHWLTGRG